MVLKRAALGATALFLAACATGPGVHPVNNSRLYEAPEGAIWPVVVRYFATQSIPIRTIERDSGIVIAEMQRMPGVMYADCGAALFETPEQRTARFNVLVQAEGPDRNRVTVTLEVEEVRRDINYMYVRRPCSSTGLFESQFLDMVGQQLSASPRPARQPQFFPPHFDALRNAHVGILPHLSRAASGIHP